MTSTSHLLSTQAAVDILQSANKAMDVAPAACPVQAVVGVKEPISDGSHDGLRAWP